MSSTQVFQIPFSSMLKSVGPRIVPFLNFIAIYFAAFAGRETNSVFSSVVVATFKAAPMISLIAFVLLNGAGLNLSDSSSYYTYSRRVLAGLIASVIGDVLMVFAWLGFWYFAAGVASFGVAHAFYLLAFGFRPLNLPGLGICLAIYFVIVINVTWQLGFALKCVGALYGLILTFMVWRAVARLQFFDDLWTWTKLCSCLGACLFGASDILLGIRLFLLPASINPFWFNVGVMFIYYSAQLGIALSVVDSQVDEFLESPVRYNYTSKKEKIN